MVTLALMIAISVAIHYLESLIPDITPVPGFKLGLSNIVSLFVLYYYGGISFIFVTLVRVLLAGLISTGFSVSFFMSLSGAVLSIVISLLLYYGLKTSIFSLSITSALFHAIGQLIAYALFFMTPYIFVYLSVLGPLSMLTGLLSAVLVRQLIIRIPYSLLSEEKKRRC